MFAEQILLQEGPKQRIFWKRQCTSMGHRSTDDADHQQLFTAWCHRRHGGVNFSLFSRSATGVELLFFDRDGRRPPGARDRLDPAANRTYHYWHVFVPGVQPGQIYGYRVQGPSDPANGMRFDPAKVLLDPYGRGVVVPKNYSRDAARQEGDNTATAMKSVVVDPHDVRLGR